jgi:hypothetical protein
MHNQIKIGKIIESAKTIDRAFDAGDLLIGLCIHYDTDFESVMCDHHIFTFRPIRGKFYRFCRNNPHAAKNGLISWDALPGTPEDRTVKEDDGWGPHIKILMHYDPQTMHEYAGSSLKNYYSFDSYCPIQLYYDTKIELLLKYFRFYEAIRKSE